MGLLDDKEIRFDCPKCGHKLRESIGWFKANNQVSCPGCGSIITLDTSNLVGELKKVEDALDQFPKKKL
jgi:transcription initiation factor IIE alpha subunit